MQKLNNFLSVGLNLKRLWKTLQRKGRLLLQKSFYKKVSGSLPGNIGVECFVPCKFVRRLMSFDGIFPEVPLTSQNTYLHLTHFTQ